MRHFQLFGCCFLMAIVSACTQTDVSDLGSGGDQEDGKDVEASTDATENPAPDTSDITSHSDDDSANAEDVLAGALARAKSEDKNVFIHLGAPW